MVNSECLKVFEERLVLKVKKQLSELDKNIEADKRLAASKGNSLSGCMINGVKGLCIKVLETRVDFIFEILSELPFKYSRKLGSRISEISLRYFPSDLGELYTRLDGIIRFVNGERTRDRVINEVVNVNITEIDRFRNLLNQFLLNLKSKKNSAIKGFLEHPVWSKVVSSVIYCIFGLFVIYIYLCWKYSLLIGPIKFVEMVLDKWQK